MWVNESVFGKCIWVQVLPWSMPAVSWSVWTHQGWLAASWSVLFQTLWRETHGSPRHLPAPGQQPASCTPEPAPEQQAGGEKQWLQILKHDQRWFGFSRNTTMIQISDKTIRFQGILHFNVREVIKKKKMKSVINLTYRSMEQGVHLLSLVGPFQTSTFHNKSISWIWFL